MDHGGTTSAKTHGSGVATFCDFLVNSQSAAKHSEVMARYPCGELKSRSAHGLTIVTVADADPFRVYRGLPVDVATQAPTVDIFQHERAALEHFLCK